MSTKDAPDSPGCEGPASVAATHPLAQAARGLQEINRPFQSPPTDPAGFEAIAAELTRAMDSGGDHRTMLFTQACLLDAMFKRYAVRDIHSPFTGSDGIPNLRNDQVNLALRSQKQCRSTIESLCTMKPQDADDSK